MNAKIDKIFSSWFWAWLLMSGLLVGGMFLLPQLKEDFSGAILFLFCTMPVRDGAYRLLEWYIEYRSSNDGAFRQRMQHFITQNDPLDSKKRVINVGFYNALWGVTLIISLMLGLLWLHYKWMAFQVVYAWIRSLEFLFTGHYTPGWLFLLIVWKITFYLIIRWGVNVILNDELQRDPQSRWWKILIMAATYLLNIIIPAFILQFSWTMFIASLIYKIVMLVLFPIGYVVLLLIGQFIYGQS